jgi:hypothetical protein
MVKALAICTPNPYIGIYKVRSRLENVLTVAAVATGTGGVFCVTISGCAWSII